MIWFKLGEQKLKRTLTSGFHGEILMQVLIELSFVISDKSLKVFSLNLVLRIITFIQSIVKI